MIKIVYGDLLKAKENIIAHQVNCQGKMGSGVALQIKNNYPDAYTSYRDAVEEVTLNNGDTKNLLGRVLGVNVGHKKWVANMFGQNNYGYDGGIYTCTESLFKCFKTVSQMARKHELTVAMPYMVGCYRGGADWKIVEELLLIAFEESELTLYKFHKG
ncbi:macro domain-containing protein [Halobacillus rhizosphaerae]|uniref:macro domain-containing protein n=1 Tax=Halobacillus rhizosphaerae TaxID=3064889 RepID=UPI00398B8919